MKVSSHLIVVEIVGISDLGLLELKVICELGGLVERRAEERVTWD